MSRRAGILPSLIGLARFWPPSSPTLLSRGEKGGKCATDLDRPLAHASPFFVLVLVLVLGVSTSSLNLRVATSIPSRKMARLRLNCEAMPCKSLGRQSEERFNGDVGVAKQRQACRQSAITTIRIAISNMSGRNSRQVDSCRPVGGLRAINSLHSMG